MSAFLPPVTLTLRPSPPLLRTHKRPLPCLLPANRRSTIHATDITATPTPSENPCHRLTAAERARTTISVCSSATLCTMSSKHQSIPFGSHVDFILDNEGRPIILLANTAVHTNNLSLESRCSLYCQPPSTFGQEGCRTTLVGDIEPLPKEDIEEWQQLYVQKHAHAVDALKFKGSFAFHRMNLIDIFFVGGYGVTSQWVDVKSFSEAEPDALAPDAPSIISQLNSAKHQDLKRLCKIFLQISHPERVNMTSLDCLGFDLRIRDESGVIREYRVAFREPVSNLFDVQSALVKVFQEAWERENGFDDTWTSEDVRPTVLYFAPV